MLHLLPFPKGMIQWQEELAQGQDGNRVATGG